MNIVEFYNIKPKIWMKFDILINIYFQWKISNMYSFVIRNSESLYVRQCIFECHLKKRVEK